VEFSGKILNFNIAKFSSDLQMGKMRGVRRVIKEENNGMHVSKQEEIIPAPLGYTRANALPKQRAITTNTQSPCMLANYKQSQKQKRKGGNQQPTTSPKKERGTKKHKVYKTSYRKS
jgi:hypothetical protein